MKELFRAPFLLAVTVSLTSIQVSAQVRANRGGQGVRGVKSVSQADASARRNKGMAVGQRGASKVPFGDSQAARNRPPNPNNRPLNPNQIRKQELQRRVMEAIGLTADQRMRMQDIRRSHGDDVIAAGRRLRQARQALDRAIMSEPYNEAEVRRATEALAAAQADKIRLDASIRAQVRTVLTPDQVQRFHELQREIRREMIEQQRTQQEDGAGGAKPPNEPEPEEPDLLSLLSFIR